MKRAALSLLLLALLIAPETAATVPDIEQGYASAYAPGVMETVVTYRATNDLWRNQPPRDLQDVDGYIASMDCNRVGQTTTLYGPDGRAYSVLIADCAGADGPSDRFSDLGIIVELDGRLWASMVAAHGTPLRIGLK